MGNGEWGIIISNTVFSITYSLLPTPYSPFLIYKYPCSAKNAGVMLSILVSSVAMAFGLPE